MSLLVPPALLLFGVILLKVREWSNLGLLGLPRIARRGRNSDSLANSSEKWLSVRASSELDRIPAAVPASVAFALTLLALSLAAYLPVRAAARAIRVRQMVADLQRAADVQEAVFGLTSSYQTTLAATVHTVSPGVTVAIESADSTGWQARSWHQSGEACRVRVVRPTGSGPRADYVTGSHVPVNISCSYGGPSP